MSITHKIIRHHQPQQPVGIDRANALGRTIKYCVVPVGSKANTWGWEVGKGIGSPTGADTSGGLPLVERYQGELGFEKQGVGARNVHWDVGLDPPTFPFTMFAKAHETGMGTTQNGGIISLNDATQSSRVFDLGLRAVSSVQVPSVVGKNEVFDTQNGPDSLNGTTFTIIGVFHSATERRLFVDGQEVAGGTGLQSAPLWTDTGASRWRMSILELVDATPSDPFGGHIFVAGVAQAAWGAAQARAFYENPWQIFNPRIIYIPVDILGTGRIMSSLAYQGGLAGMGGIAGQGGGLAA